MTRTEVANTHCVKLIISVGSTFYVANAGARCVGPISLLWTGNTISSISLALCALRSLVRKTVTTSMKDKFTVTTTTQRNSLSDVMGARQRY